MAKIVGRSNRKDFNLGIIPSDYRMQPTRLSKVGTANRHASL